MRFSSSLTSLTPRVAGRLRLLLLGLIVACCCLPRAAHAQKIDPLTNTAFDRDRPREGRELPYDINLNDCLEADVLHFDLKVVGPTSDNFQVWVGDTDCTKEEERDNDDARCWLVHSGQAENASFTIDIPVQNIIARKRPQDGVGSSVHQGTVADCDNVWEGKVSLYFMYVSDLSVAKSHVIWSQTTVDLKGPTPPTEVKASPGDQGVELEWSASNSTDLAGYRFYCAENGSTATANGGSTNAGGAAGSNGGGMGGLSEGGSGGASEGGSSDGGTGANTPSSGDAGPTSCGAASLVPGKVPSGLKECGSEKSSTSISGRATGLTNGIEYAVAVAAVDELGNPGPLSEVACSVPENITTFFESYRASGGQGGGGICSVTEPGAKAGSSYGLLGLLLASSLLWRRVARRP